MKITKFEDIESWKISRNLATQVYKIFASHHDFGFKNQITRAVVSISNNIAEGYERQSNNELKQFLYIAKGSAGEVRSMLYIAMDLGYCTDEQFQELYTQTLLISKLLSGFISYLHDYKNEMNKNL